jgi:hypothetical protein
MHMMGLHGKSFMPILLGFGCNVPAILGTRIIESRRARLLTTLLIPLVPCTARMAVITILASVFFGPSAFWIAWGLVGFSLLILAGLGLVLHHFFFENEHDHPGSHINRVGVVLLPQRHCDDQLSEHGRKIYAAGGKLDGHALAFFRGAADQLCGQGKHGGDPGRLVWQFERAENGDDPGRHAGFSGFSNPVYPLRWNGSGHSTGDPFVEMDRLQCGHTTGFVARVCSCGFSDWEAFLRCCAGF